MHIYLDTAVKLLIMNIVPETKSSCVKVTTQCNCVLAFLVYAAALL